MLLIRVVKKSPGVSAVSFVVLPPAVYNLRCRSNDYIKNLKLVKK